MKWITKVAKVGLGLGILMGCAGVQAQTPINNEGWFAGLTGNDLRFRDDSVGVSPNGIAVGGIAGYQFNDYVAVEGRVMTSTRSVDLGGATLKLNHYVGASVVGFLPITEEFSLYGQAGFGQGQLQVSGGGVVVGGNETDVSYGFGVKYREDNYSVRFGYENLLNTDTVKVYGMSASMMYHF